MADFSKKDLDRLKEVNFELEKRTRRTKAYIDLEKEQLALRKKQLQTEKDIEKINASEESIQKRINALGKAKQGSFVDLVKSYAKMNFSAAAELHTKRKINKEETQLAGAQKSISELLAKDVKDKKITIGDSKKILTIQEGINTGKIKEGDIAGKLGGLSKKFTSGQFKYGKMLGSQAKSQKNIGGMLSSGASSFDGRNSFSF